MKKTKRQIKTIKTLVTIAVLAIAIASVYIFLKSENRVVGATIYFDSENAEKIINLSEYNITNNYKNIYNVSHMQQSNMPIDNLNFEATALAKIRGEKVTFTNYYYGNTDYLTKNETTIEGDTCIENNIMAAIVSGVGVENIGFKYNDQGQYYSSGAQLAIWEFWNTWVEKSGAKENGFEKGMGNGTITENGLNGEVERKKAQECTIENLYNVNIYFLKYFPHNNLSTSKDYNLGVDNQPNLILIEVLDEEDRLIEPETSMEDVNISLSVTSNIENEVVVGEEILYNTIVYNKSEEQQENLILTSLLPENVTFINVVEIVDYNEVQLNENIDYTYNEDTKTLQIQIDKIDAKINETEIDQETGETMEYSKMGSRQYKITVRAEKLEDEIYSKQIKNIVKVQRKNIVLVKKEIVNILTDAFLEINIEELPEKINENQECVIGLKITNKGLISAENVAVRISIPEEISMKSYRKSLLSESGEEESTINGVTSNEFEDDFIQIPAQKTIYLKLIGTIKEIEETKSITIEGMVNNKKIVWNTKIYNVEERGLLQ